MPARARQHRGQGPRAARAGTGGGRGVGLLTGGQAASTIGDSCYTAALPWYVLTGHGGAPGLATIRSPAPVEIFAWVMRVCVVGTKSSRSPLSLADRSMWSARGETPLITACPAIGARTRQKSADGAVIWPDGAGRWWRSRPSPTSKPAGMQAAAADLAALAAVDWPVTLGCPGLTLVPMSGGGRTAIRSPSCLGLVADEGTARFRNSRDSLICRIAAWLAGWPVYFLPP